MTFQSTLILRISELGWIIRPRRSSCRGSVLSACISEKLNSPNLQPSMASGQQHGLDSLPRKFASLVAEAGTILSEAAFAVLTGIAPAPSRWSQHYCEI